MCVFGGTIETLLTKLTSNKVVILDQQDRAPWMASADLVVVVVVVVVDDRPTSLDLGISLKVGVVQSSCLVVRRYFVFAI